VDGDCRSCVKASLVTMKEIDFLPEWYRDNVRRQVNIRRQYIVLGGVFGLMVLWSLLAAHSVSRAKAGLAQVTSVRTNRDIEVSEYFILQDRIAQLQGKAEILDEADSRIDIAGVLGELSFLVDKRIVLNKVEFKAEKPVSLPGNSRRAKGPWETLDAGNSAPIGDVKFRVIIGGLAVDGSDVAELVCRLEDSVYFCNVIPIFSRNSDVKRMKSIAKLTGFDRQVTEFELSCYLANYRQDDQEG